MPRADLGTNHVAFVIHGIRDRGFWTRRIARYVKAYAHEQGLKCRCVTSTYGYFPMGPFLLPWVRRAKVEWLLDQYVTAKALYPDAAFAYVGHSNGTYLLARALELCPEVRFRRVVFAGSVVSDGYDWQRFLPGGDGAQGRIEAFVNYVATGDWVVAIFPNGLRRLRLQTDLGGAGHNGFDDGVDRMGPAIGSSPTAPVLDIKYMPGGHSAALTVENWSDIARFVIDERPTPPIAAQAVQEPSPRVAFLGEWSWAIWLALVVAGVGIACWLLWSIGNPGWLIALVLLAYLEALRAVLTRA